MSAADEDEFGVGEDLEALLADTPAPTKKKITTAKMPADPVTDRPEPIPEAPMVQPAPALDPAVLREALAEMREQIRAEVLREIQAAQPTPQPTPAPLDANAMMAAQQPPVEVPAEEGRRIHFIEDGVTIGGRVFYRGEEFVVAMDAEWATLSGREQILRYGKRMYREGHWDGDGFDLSDPALTEDDRHRLLDIVRKQATYTGVT